MYLLLIGTAILISGLTVMLILWTLILVQLENYGKSAMHLAPEEENAAVSGTLAHIS